MKALVAILAVALSCAALVGAQSARAAGDCGPDLAPLVRVTHPRTAAELGLRDTTDLVNPRQVFETSFDVYPRSDDPVFDWARAHLVHWLSNLRVVRPPVRKEIGRALRADAPVDVVRVAVESSELDLVIVEPTAPAGGRRLAVLVEHPDQREHDLVWRSEISLDELANGGVHVTSSVLTWRPSGRRPHPGGGSVPRAVGALMDDPRGTARSGTLPIAASPLELGANDVAGFMAMIKDPQRLLPIIYVSRRATEPVLPLDIAEIALRLRGFARVVIAADAPGETSSKFAAAKGVVRIIGTGGVDLGSYNIPPDAEQLKHQIIRHVIKRSTDDVRSERGLWTNSVFDLLP